jgi:stage II sporulation protein D
VGSLQKPFVAKAWSQAFPGRGTPRLRCGPASGCWRPSGHGELGLARALAVSCNAYFRALAAEVPPDRLARAFAAEGFQGAPSSPDEALGLEGEGGGLLIAPADLLRAYRRLVDEPWSEGEAVRQEVLRGLREAAREGTALGLKARGGWAKTGTMPSRDPGPTAGVAITLDEAGGAILARLLPGTGREAAKALGGLGAGGTRAPRTMVKPGSTRAGEAARTVRVRMMDLLGAQGVEVRNLGSSPLPCGRGFLGPGATRALAPGLTVGPGLLELSSHATGFQRRLEGRVDARRGQGKAWIVVATLSARDYVEGVIAAELPTGALDRKVALGAAVLRFLRRGPRHGPVADVCDSTHCAWFVGRGPRLVWRGPRRATVQDPGEPAPLTEEAWVAVRRQAAEPGPDLWTAHCGGAPLAERAVWGRGAAEPWPCDRHAGGASTRPWTRTWTAETMDRAFGGAVSAVVVTHPGGVWTLEVTTPAGTRAWSYDLAHRRLAAVLGWDALPSPADAVEPVPGGWRARGAGWGHRVGLCLGD